MPVRVADEKPQEMAKPPQMRHFWSLSCCWPCIFICTEIKSRCVPLLFAGAPQDFNDDPKTEGTRFLFSKSLCHVMVWKLPLSAGYVTFLLQQCSASCYVSSLVFKVLITLLWMETCLQNYLLLTRASLAAQLVKNPPAMQETWVQSLGWEDLLVKWKATHASILSWRIPWTAVRAVTESDTPSLSLSRFQVFPEGLDLGIQGSGPSCDSVVLPWLPFKCLWAKFVSILCWQIYPESFRLKHVFSEKASHNVALIKLTHQVM